MPAPKIVSVNRGALQRAITRSPGLAAGPDPSVRRRRWALGIAAGVAAGAIAALPAVGDLLSEVAKSIKGTRG